MANLNSRTNKQEAVVMNDVVRAENAAAESNPKPSLTSVHTISHLHQEEEDSSPESQRYNVSSQR